MKRIVLLHIFCFFSVVCSVNATEIMVRGQVWDQDDNPLENVRVVLKGAKLQTTTDADGWFDFRNAISVVTKREIRTKEKVTRTYKIYTPNGREITNVQNNAIPQNLAAGLYVMTDNKMNGRIVLYQQNNKPVFHGGEKRDTETPSYVRAGLARRKLVAIDTVMFTKDGFYPKLYPVETYNEGCYVFLKKTVHDSVIPGGMKHIPGGWFEMGSATGDPDERPVRDVWVSSFFMDSTEVTQKEYFELLGVKPWARYPDKAEVGDNYPVWAVNWFDAVVFCNAKSKAEGRDTAYTYTSISGTPGDSCIVYDVKLDTTKRGHRLPTEAEWEYACRAETNTQFFWGDDESKTDNYVWYGDNSGRKMHAVAQKKPNAFGIYDMLGNAEEWVYDWHRDYDPNVTIDPIAKNSGLERVLRGGTYVTSNRSNLSCANRAHLFPDRCSVYEGFRTVIPYRPD